MPGPYSRWRLTYNVSIPNMIPSLIGSNGYGQMTQIKFLFRLGVTVLAQLWSDLFY